MSNIILPGSRKFNEAVREYNLTDMVNIDSNDANANEAKGFFSSAGAYIVPVAGAALSAAILTGCPTGIAGEQPGAEKKEEPAAEAKAEPGAEKKEEPAAEAKKDEGKREAEAAKPKDPKADEIRGIADAVEGVYEAQKKAAEEQKKKDEAQTKAIEEANKKDAELAKKGAELEGKVKDLEGKVPEEAKKAVKGEIDAQREGLQKKLREDVETVRKKGIVESSEDIYISLSKILGNYKDNRSQMKYFSDGILNLEDSKKRIRITKKDGLYTIIVEKEASPEKIEESVVKEGAGEEKRIKKIPARWVPEEEYVIDKKNAGKASRSVYISTEAKEIKIPFVGGILPIVVPFRIGPQTKKHIFEGVLTDSDIANIDAVVDELMSRDAAWYASDRGQARLKREGLLLPVAADKRYGLSKNQAGIRGGATVANSDGKTIREAGHVRISIDARGSGEEQALELDAGFKYSEDSMANGEAVITRLADVLSSLKLGPGFRIGLEGVYQLNTRSMPTSVTTSRETTGVDWLESAMTQNDSTTERLYRIAVPLEIMIGALTIKGTAIAREGNTRSQTHIDASITGNVNGIPVVDFERYDIDVEAINRMFGGQGSIGMKFNGHAFAELFGGSLHNRVKIKTTTTDTEGDISVDNHSELIREYLAGFGLRVADIGPVGEAGAMIYTHLPEGGRFDNSACADAYLVSNIKDLVSAGVFGGYKLGDVYGGLNILVNPNRFSHASALAHRNFLRQIFSHRVDWGKTAEQKKMLEEMAFRDLIAGSGALPGVDFRFNKLGGEGIWSLGVGGAIPLDSLGITKGPYNAVAVFEMQYNDKTYAGSGKLYLALPLNSALIHVGATYDKNINGHKGSESLGIEAGVRAFIR